MLPSTDVYTNIYSTTRAQASKTRGHKRCRNRFQPYPNHKVGGYSPNSPSFPLRSHKESLSGSDIRVPRLAVHCGLQKWPWLFARTSLPSQCHVTHVTGNFGEKSSWGYIRMKRIELSCKNVCDYAVWNDMYFLSKSRWTVPCGFTSEPPLTTPQLFIHLFLSNPLPSTPLEGL